MYAILATKQYRKSLRGLAESGSFPLSELEVVIGMLASGKPLPQRNKDHKLTGALKAYRECHVKDDILLVYQIRKRELILLLVDIGSHAHVFQSS